ncbi:hypothetical protein FKP32DRAFT_730754 [Trametes sanguinea]|nr:hypothetical protein FKP32DRAFT_730754 [Trametes sanguinea]
MRRAFVAAVTLRLLQQHRCGNRTSTFAAVVGTAAVRHPSSRTMIAGPLFSRSQSHFSQDTVSEYVEDSEPEREERRVRQRSQSKQPRTKIPVKTALDVIELSDSEDSGQAGPSKPSTSKKPERPRIVIDVLDSSDGMESSDLGGRSLATRETNPMNASEQIPSMFEDCTTDDSFPSIREIMKLPRRATSNEPRKPHAIATSSTLGPSVPTVGPDREPIRTAPATLDESETSGEGEGALKLARFAYANPNPMRRTLSKTPSPTERGSAPPTEGQAGTKVRRNPTPTHRFADDFSDAQLSRLLKCVSCDLTWTVRKTALQKMKHIQSCAKRNALNDETVKTLILKELDSLPPIASTSKDSAPASAHAATPIPETLLEDALKDVGKKKPGRRPQVLQTVKSIDETRNTILDKARSLLQSNSSSRASSVLKASAGGLPTAKHIDAPPATQVFSKSNIAATADPLENAQANTTHLYAPSRLAAQASRLHEGIVRTGAEIAAHSDISPLTQASIHIDAAFDEPHSDIEDAPPATQVFAPSKLTSFGGGVSRRVVNTTVAEPLEDPISIHDTDEDNIGLPSPQRPVRPLFEGITGRDS